MALIFLQHQCSTQEHVRRVVTKSYWLHLDLRPNITLLHFDLEIMKPHCGVGQRSNWSRLTFSYARCHTEKNYLFSLRKSFILLPSSVKIDSWPAKLDPILKRFFFCIDIFGNFIWVSIFYNLFTLYNLWSVINSHQ